MIIIHWNCRGCGVPSSRTEQDKALNSLLWDGPASREREGLNHTALRGPFLPRASLWF